MAQQLPAISKILSDASKVKTRKGKINFLRSHRPNTAMLQILKYAFDPRIEFLLPNSDPPYNPTDPTDADTLLYPQARKLYLFVEGGAPNLHQTRRETIFVDMLESVHPNDAKLLLAVKNKNIPYRGITEKLVREAFPNLLSPNPNEVKDDEEEED